MRCCDIYSIVGASHCNKSYINLQVCVPLLQLVQLTQNRSELTYYRLLLFCFCCSLLVGFGYLYVISINMVLDSVVS